MKNLIVVAFDDEEGGSHFLEEVDGLQKQALINLDDAAMLIRTKDGKVKLRQARSLVGDGTLGGAFWGILVGLVFWMPVVGMALSAAMGAGIGKASDYGISDAFINEVAEKLEPGTSAIFLLIHNAQPERAIDHLRGLGGIIIYTSLTEAQEMQLKEAFGSAA
jgi:uncharacterized membrane protein